MKLQTMRMKIIYYDVKKSKLVFHFIFIWMVVKTEVCGPQNVDSIKFKILEKLWLKLFWITVHDKLISF